MARVNEMLREVVAEELERLVDIDDRLGMLTVTAVECEPDMRHAKVLLASLDPAVADVLGESRVRLQAAISSQVRLKRTPQLSFAVDPALVAGSRVEELLRELIPPRLEEPEGAPGDEVEDQLDGSPDS